MPFRAWIIEGTLLSMIRVRVRVRVDISEKICRHEFFQSNSLGILALNFLPADFLA